MRWTHVAIKNQYRGWNGTTADHNYKWHDSVHAKLTGADGGTPTSGTNSCGYNTLAVNDN
jgi:hypothetical protein